MPWRKGQLLPDEVAGRQWVSPTLLVYSGLNHSTIHAAGPVRSSGASSTRSPAAAAGPRRFQRNTRRSRTDGPAAAQSPRGYSGTSIRYHSGIRLTMEWASMQASRIFIAAVLSEAPTRACALIAALAFADQPGAFRPCRRYLQCGSASRSPGGRKPGRDPQTRRAPLPGLPVPRQQEDGRSDDLCARRVLLPGDGHRERHESGDAASHQLQGRRPRLVRRSG